MIFTKYPRTPALFGSKGTDDDKPLGEAESNAFNDDASLIVEEKIDGTNVGIHFSDSGAMVLQCRGHLITETISSPRPSHHRGHLITEGISLPGASHYRGHLITGGMHPQYGLFKQWTAAKRYGLARQLQNRVLLFGEWVYARHSIHYCPLTHNCFEFDIYDKEQDAFQGLNARLALLAGTGIPTVPVVHTGRVKRDDLEELIGPSRFDSQFENRRGNRFAGLRENPHVPPCRSGTAGR